MKDDKITSGILGLGGTTVPKTPGDPSTEYDEDSVEQRTARMREGEEETVVPDAGHRHAGATGIDMGSGGEGTDLSGK